MLRLENEKRDRCWRRSELALWLALTCKVSQNATVRLRIFGQATGGIVLPRRGFKQHAALRSVLLTLHELMSFGLLSSSSDT
jgi:hypothetical protein